jgi:hypothetical protein
MVKYLVTFAVILTIMGCQERYRYPCQDPNNWEEKMCKKPYCSANGTCPEDLRHYEKNSSEQSKIPQQNFNNNSNKGACKC